MAEVDSRKTVLPFTTIRRLAGLLEVTWRSSRLARGFGGSGGSFLGRLSIRIDGADDLA